IFVGNYLGQTWARAASGSEFAEGHATLRGEFVYDGGGYATGATLALFVNDKKVGEARMPVTQAISLGLGGALDVGLDTGAAVDGAAYTPPYRFNGTIDAVTIDLKPAAK
ncbi:MAG: arylsulfatase, partial [Candidatus Eisenbacteria bacterium]